MKTSSFAGILALASAGTARSSWSVGQTVSTTSGHVNGHAASDHRQVSEYLGIPYAKAPTGDLRWKVPQRYTSNETLSGLDFGDACLQTTQTRGMGNGSYNYMDHIIPSGYAVLTSNTFDGNYSEDCLYLNVWTKPQTGEKKKAVLVWIHGGSFISGTGSSTMHDGQYLAELEDIVMVTINYRLSVFSTPGSDAVSQQNLAMLDQRAALEWVRDNIEGFGGDPDRIVLAGQSSGSIHTDMHSYAWANDPLVAGYISMSAQTTSFVFQTPETAAERWYALSASLGCGDGATDSTPDEVLACMMELDAEAIAANVNSDALPGSSPEGLWWGPVVDDELVFPDYSGLTPAQRPMLLGSTNNETTLFQMAVTYELTPEYIANTTAAIFTCPSAERASKSYDGAETWRYRFMGEFPNTIIAYDPPSAVWHGNELMGLFGTTSEILVENTEAQDSINAWMQNAWATFAKEGGLSEWPQYAPDTQSLVQIGYNNVTGLNLELGEAFDFVC